MSHEQLLAFGKKVQSDESLREEIARLAQDSAGIVAAAKREGFDFTEAELDAYLQAAASESGVELDDIDLEAVVGSGNPTVSCLCPTITD